MSQHLKNFVQACHNNDVIAVRNMIDGGFCIRLDGDAGVIEAFSSGSCEVVHILLEHKKDDKMFLIETLYGLSTNKAIEHGHLNIVKNIFNFYLMHYNSVCCETLSYPLTLAALKGDIDLVDFVLNHPKSNKQLMCYKEILYHISRNGDLETFETFFTHPSMQKYASKISEFNLNNYLDLACEAGNLSLVQYLLTSKSISIHASINSEFNPLFHALFNKKMDVVKYLLSSTELVEVANINQVNLTNLELNIKNEFLSYYEEGLLNRKNIEKKQKVKIL